MTPEMYQNGVRPYHLNNRQNPGNPYHVASLAK